MVSTLSSKERADVPSEARCMELLHENRVPQNIIDHMRKVAEVAMGIVDRLHSRGIAADRDMVLAASLLHDIEKLKEDHVIKGAELIARKGYPKVARVMSTHGLEHVREAKYYPQTIEEKIVFYADKRVKNDKVVSIDERFNDIRKRYNLPHIEEEFQIAKKIERELSEGA